MNSSCVALAAALLLTFGAERAEACSFAQPAEHSLDDAEKAVDQSAPGAPSALDASVTRGGPAESDGCSTTQSSCDDVGTISVRFAAAEDDRTDAAGMGYVMTLVSGSAPITLPPGAVRTDADGALHFAWVDGASEDQELIDFTITLQAVDRAGNTGPVSAPLRIRDSGSDSGGCGISGPGTTPAGVVLLLALLGVLRRAARGQPGCT